MLGVRGVLGGAAGGGRLEGEADVDDLLDVAGPRDDDLEAAVAVDLHEPGLGQPQQGLPHRAAGDVEQVSELVDGVRLVRDELTGGDAGADGLDDRVGERGCAVGERQPDHG